MKLTTLSLAIAAAALIPPVSRAASHTDWSIHVSINDREPLTSCEQITATSRRGEIARGEETATLPATSEGVRISGSTNGGVYARGTDEPQYTIRLCTFAVARTADEARPLVDATKLAVSNGVVSVVGPNGHDWVAHLIVLAPRDARVDFEATNGPLSLHSLTGRIGARVKNGPVSLRSSTGEIHIDAVNGPMDLSEVSGSVRAIAQNGPVAVTLSGRGWQGAGLTAQAVNGPLTLKLPEGYETGVLVEMSGHSPLHCRAALCAEGTVTTGRSHAHRFGPSDAPVRLSSQNGPVSIVARHD